MKLPLRSSRSFFLRLAWQRGLQITRSRLARLALAERQGCFCSTGVTVLSHDSLGCHTRRSWQIFGLARTWEPGAEKYRSNFRRVRRGFWSISKRCPRAQSGVQLRARTANLDNLSNDAQCDFFRRSCTDVKADGAVDLFELGFTEAESAKAISSFGLGNAAA